MAVGWSDWDWGTVPAWVGTIVTGSSFWIAALSYRRSVRDKEGEQASRIAAWYQISEEHGLSRLLYISNGSDGPIYDVVARAESDPEITLPELPAKATTVVERGSIEGSYVFDLSKTTSDVTFTQAIEWREPSLELEFRDGMGRRWRRSGNGHLRQLKRRTHTLVVTDTYQGGNIYYTGKSEGDDTGRSSPPSAAPGSGETR